MCVEAEIRAILVPMSAVLAAAGVAGVAGLVVQPGGPLGIPLAGTQDRQVPFLLVHAAHLKHWAMFGNDPIHFLAQDLQVLRKRIMRQACNAIAVAAIYELRESDVSGE